MHRQLYVQVCRTVVCVRMDVHNLHSIVVEEVSAGIGSWRTGHLDTAQFPGELQFVFKQVRAMRHPTFCAHVFSTLP